MKQLVEVEFFKLRKRMMAWVVALLMVAFVVLLYSVLWSTSVRVAHFGETNQFTGLDLRQGLYLPAAIPYALQIVASFGATLAMILAAGAIGSEYAWGTVRLMATASSGRLRLISAKLLVVFGFTAAGTLLAVAAALAYSAIITFYYGNASASFLTASFARDQLAAYGRTLFVLAPYVTLAFGMAVVGRSTLAGVGTGMGVAFLEPLIGALMRTAGSPWKDIPDYLLNANARIILLQNKVPEVLPRFGGGRGEITVAHSPVVAGLIVMGYTLAFISVSFYLFRTRDISSSQ
jgi:ABC-type transport system involved in multi-copper enzyme maturation permease subunit